MKKLLAVLIATVVLSPMNFSAAQVEPQLFECPPEHPGVDLVPEVAEYCGIRDLILELEQVAADTANDVAFRTFAEAQAAMWEAYLLTYGPDLGPEGNTLYTTPSWALAQQALDEEWLPGDPLYEALNLDNIPPGDKTTADAPFRGMFYYPWYPQDWGTCTSGNPSRSHFNPTRGCYSQDQVAGQPNPVIFEHVNDMRNAGVEVAISSWYRMDPGSTLQSNRDKRFLDLLNASVGTDLTWALYYEREGFDSGNDPGNFGDPRWDQIRADLNYAMSRYGAEPNYMRLHGKPVVFVFGDPSDGCGDGLDPALAGPTEMVERWRRAIQQSSRRESIPAPNVHVVFKVFPGYDSCPADAYPRGSAARPSFSFHQYAPAAPTDQVHNPVSTALAPGSWGTGSYVISPGFWKFDEAAPRDNFPLGPGSEDATRDLVEFRQSVRTMSTSARSWQLITTYNEFIEGTQVEADTRFGSIFLNAIANNGVEPGVQGRIAGAGDIACRASDPGNDGVPPFSEPPEVGTTGCHMRDTSDQILAQNPPVTDVLVLGDSQYEDGESENYGASYNATWGRLKAITRPSTGNHEYNLMDTDDPDFLGSSDENGDGIGGDGYFSYFGAAAGPRRPLGPGQAEGVYSFNVGSWLFISLNSSCSQAGPGGCGVGSNQWDFLRNAVEQHAGSCEVVYMHHQRFSDGSHGNSNEEDTDAVNLDGSLTGPQRLKHLYRQASALGVELWLVGHDHDYQRYPMAKDVDIDVPGIGIRGIALPDPEFGVRQVIIGTGGRNTTGVDTSDPGPGSSWILSDGTKDMDPERYHGTAFGIFTMELRPNDGTFRFIVDPDDTDTAQSNLPGAAGQQMDQFNTTCHN
jgi:hypothetical protein